MTAADVQPEQHRLATVYVRLRYLSIAAQLITIAFARYQISLQLPYVPLLATVAAIAAFNLASHAWLMHQSRIDVRWLRAQLAFDVCALTALLYFSGGPANPFVSLYLIPIALAAGALGFATSLGLALLSVVLYAFLLGHHVPLPHAHGNDFDLHITGMWINFLLSTTVLVAVLGRFTQQLRAERDRSRALRERVLRDESVLALGTLAAGTAHELNTPLTTLGLLIDEAEDERENADFATMRAELARCRAYLDALVQLARGGTETFAAIVPLVPLVRQTAERMQLLRPEIELRLDVTHDNALVRSDATLGQALANLIDNAAKASQAGGARSVDISVRNITERAVVVEIADLGPGPDRAPDAVIPAGLGVGLLLSNATIERFGGEVRQLPRAGGGCITQMTLPTEGVGA